MPDQSRYITVEDLRAKTLKLRIERIEREIIDERPHLVVYFQDFDKGLILTRQIADDITKAYGRNPKVEAFFASPEGQEH